MDFGITGRTFARPYQIRSEFLRISQIALRRLRYYVLTSAEHDIFADSYIVRMNLPTGERSAVIHLDSLSA